MESLESASANIRLKINTKKIKLITNSIEQPLKVNGNLLEYVKEILYLQKMNSFDKETNEPEINRWIQKTWNKFWNLKDIFESNMPIKLKTKIMN